MRHLLRCVCVLLGFLLNKDKNDVGVVTRFDEVCRSPIVVEFVGIRMAASKVGAVRDCEDVHP